MIPRAWSLSVLATFLFAWSLCSGCATYSSGTLKTRTALDDGLPTEALANLNAKLGVDEAHKLPDKHTPETALTLLDRAMVLQQLGRYILSSRDLEAADKQVELLDFSRKGIHDIGKYMYSDDVGPYRAPSYEKLAINTVNLVNYLARGDLNGARVEARRLTVVQDYLRSHGEKRSWLFSAGSYLAGFTFEKSGEADQALRYYDEALQASPSPSLANPIRRLAEQASYRSPRILKLLPREGDAHLAQAPSKNTSGQPYLGATVEPTGEHIETTPAPNQAPPADNSGDLLVVFCYGRAPAKLEKLVPISAAVREGRRRMSAGDVVLALWLAEKGVVSVVRVPALEKRQPNFDTPKVAVDGTWYDAEPTLALDGLARRAWEDARGAVFASALTRMVTRAAAGKVLESATKKSGWGQVLNLLTQVTLTATDTPDTRSWTTLPARIGIARFRLPPGEHLVVLESRGVWKKHKVRMTAGGWAALNLTVLR